MYIHFFIWGSLHFFNVFLSFANLKLSQILRYDENSSTQMCEITYTAVRVVDFVQNYWPHTEKTKVSF